MMKLKLLEDKISWILKLEKNSQFKKTDQTSSFELGPWILFADYNGAKLFLKTIEDYFYAEHKVLYFLSKLPDTEKEFDEMILKIVKNGEPVEDRVEVRYYRDFMNLSRSMLDINSELKREHRFNLKSVLSKKERLKVSILEVLRIRFLKKLKLDFTITTLWFEFWYIVIYFLGIILLKNEFKFLEFLMILSFVLLISIIFHYLRFFKQNKRIKKVFNSIDELGIDFYKTDFKLFLRQFLTEKEANSIITQFLFWSNSNLINSKDL